MNTRARLARADRKAATAAGLALAPALVAALLTWRVYRQPVEVAIDFEHSYEGGFVTGFHDRERAGAESFRWTTGESYLRLEGLPRRAIANAEIRLKALRPAVVRITANDATIHQGSAAGLTTWRFALPVPSEELTVGIHSDTFLARDGRRLGVQVLSFRLSVSEGRAPLSGPIGWMGLGAAAFFAAGRAAGLSAVTASIAASTLLAGFATLLAQDSVRFLPYPCQIAALGLAALVIAGVLRVAFSQATWLRPALVPAVVAVLTGSAILKLSGLFYPLFVSSDALFQANRFGELLHGNWFPVSVTQHASPFQIPYPVALYVVAAPGALAGLDPVRVLQLVAGLADWTAGLALVYLAARFWNDARAGIFAAALHALVPINFMALSAGNLTNVFGVATTLLFLTALLCLAASGSSWARGATFVSSVLALTSHLSTFLLGMVLTPGWLLVIRWTFPGLDRRRWWTCAGLAAAGVAVALLYYTGYLELFLSQARRAAEGGALEGTRVPAGWLGRLSSRSELALEQMGAGFLLLTAAGTVAILRRPRSTPLHGAVGVWIAATALFLLLDLLTGIEVRYVLGAAPLLALVSGRFLAWLSVRRPLGFWTAWLVMGWFTWQGLASFYQCVTQRYH